MEKRKWQKEMGYYRFQLEVLESQADFNHVRVKKQAIKEIMDEMEKTKAVLPSNVKRNIYYKNSSQSGYFKKPKGYKNKKGLHKFYLSPLNLKSKTEKNKRLYGKLWGE